MATRRKTLAKWRNRNGDEDPTVERLCDDIRAGELIPVIGDTVRSAHIFDLNADDNLDGEEGQAVLAEDDPLYRQQVEYERIKDRLSVTDELAYQWAVGIGYPLLDSYRLARVAQYLALEEGDPVVAKRDYLNFCKWYLLQIMKRMPEIEGNAEEEALVAALENDLERLSFSDIVVEMDFSPVQQGRQDTLRMLAQLPLKVYLTTGYYDFVERELMALGKRPRSCLCFWKQFTPARARPEHRLVPEEPTVQEPVVYHLFGMEQYPESMILSEDDHLAFLAEVAGRNPDGGGKSVIPGNLIHHLNNSTLLLLGYRLQDWDFRTLFHVFLNPDNPFALERNRKSWAIQVALEQQPLVANRQKAGEYLANYFDKAQFDVEWGEADDFVKRLWQHCRS